MKTIIWVRFVQAFSTAYLHQSIKMANRNILTVQRMHDIAGIRNGRCLSKDYVNSVTPLKWMCSKGHTWDMTYRSVQQGGWCVQCARKNTKQEYLDELQRLAEKRGGTCVSKEYVNCKTKLKWRCRRKHVFYMSPNVVKSGRCWCEKCTILDGRETMLDKLKSIARSKKGKCLSNTYLNKHSKIRFRCSEGHEFSSSANFLSYGHWCAACKKIKSNEGKLRILQAIAIKRGGKCLSLKFIRKDVKLEWECALGHRFTAKPHAIKNQGTWCPLCGNETIGRKQRKYSIEKLQRLAKKRKGKLLSDHYKNILVPIQWECAEGHRWFASIDSIVRRNSWCKKCHLEKIGKATRR